MELYKKYRPKIFKEIIGQVTAANMLVELCKKNKIPQAILLTGPSGSGKTTIARILQRKLQCDDVDYIEYNATEFGGVNDIRELRSRMNVAPMKSPVRLYLIDEAHGLTTHAQNALLKVLEDTPKHIHIILATTDPQKILKTVMTRCTEIKLVPVAHDDLVTLVKDVAGKEKVKLSKPVVTGIAEAADGSARKALVILNQIIGITKEDEQLDAISKSETKQQAINLCRILMNPRSQWKEIAVILKGLEDDPETVRRMVLGYMSSVLLNRSDNRIALIIECFLDNFFDSGKAGLTLACYNAKHIK